MSKTSVEPQEDDDQLSGEQPSGTGKMTYSAIMAQKMSSM